MSKSLRIYRAILLGKMININKELECYQKNLDEMDENPEKFKNEKTLRKCLEISINDITEYYNKLLGQLEIIDNRLDEEEEENEKS